MAKTKETKKSSTAKRGRDGRFTIQSVHDVLKEKYKGTVDPAASVYLALVLQGFTVDFIWATAHANEDSNGKTPSVLTKEMFQPFTRSLSIVPPPEVRPRKGRNGAARSVCKEFKDVARRKITYLLPNWDKECGEFLNTLIANLLDFVATNAAANMQEGRELTVSDVKRVLDDYLTGLEAHMAVHLLEAAKVDGDKMYQEIGFRFLPKFKPKPSPKPIKRKRASTTRANAPSKQKTTKSAKKVTPKPGPSKRKRASTSSE